MHATVQPNQDQVRTIEVHETHTGTIDLVIATIEERFDGSGAVIVLTRNHWQMIADGLAEVGITATTEEN